jgi:hypothetical protein
MRKSYAERKSNGQENQRYLGKIQGANIVPNRIAPDPHSPIDVVVGNLGLNIHTPAVTTWKNMGRGT